MRALGELVEIDAGHAKVVAPAYRHAGMHYDQLALPLGLVDTKVCAIDATWSALRLVWRRELR